MPEAVSGKQTKKIVKAKVGKQVRLWVRAKFLSFRRYSIFDADPKFSRTSTRAS